MSGHSSCETIPGSRISYSGGGLGTPNVLLLSFDQLLLSRYLSSWYRLMDFVVAYMEFLRMG